MITKRPAASRGKTEFDWLLSRHTFSFGDYYDPEQLGFRSLRVLNDDIVAPGRGFGKHSHRDAEIVSYVLEGELEHRDSIGNGAVLGAGTVQYMSAGSGVVHSEFNPSNEERVHFLQIWLLPNVQGALPRYEQKLLSPNPEPNSLELICAGSARDGSIAIRQDAELSIGRLGRHGSLRLTLAAGRGGWLQVVRGALTAGKTPLAEGDGAGISDEPQLIVTAEAPAEFLWFDLS